VDLPEHLLPDDVVEACLWAGFRIDRRNVTRALEQTPIPGVLPLPRRGVAGQIPRAALADVLAVCLRRRDLRERAPKGLHLRPIEEYRRQAAERMMRVPWLAPLVSEPAAQLIRKREAAEKARERGARKKAAEQEREARRAEEARLEQIRARKQAEREERARREEQEWRRRAYFRCAVLVLEQIGCLYGKAPSPRPPAFNADWPTSPPDWWLPPPGMVEAMQAEPRIPPPGYRSPDLSHLMAPYVLGHPWPWRNS
jgi:hypothetical protein